MVPDQSVRWILGSSSPRRAELLGMLGQPFAVVKPRIVELRKSGEDPRTYVLRNCREKAAAVCSQLTASPTKTIIICADTIVVLGKKVLEKPESQADAARMLGELSGSEHEVISGLGVGLLEGTAPLRLETCSVHTKVRFKTLSQSEIMNYVKTGEPMDKAGAYGAQGIGACFVQRLDGSYTNVVGLPMVELTQLLTKLGCYS